MGVAFTITKEAERIVGGDKISGGRRPNHNAIYREVRERARYITKEYHDLLKEAGEDTKLFGTYVYASLRSCVACFYLSEDLEVRLAKLPTEDEMPIKSS